MISDLAKLAFNVIQQIRTQAKKAKVNNRQCNRLLERLQVIEQSLRGLESLPETTAFAQALEQLLEPLHAGLALVESYTNQHWIKRFLKAGGHGEDFADLNRHLTQAADALQLGIGVQGLFDRAHDKTDQEKDFAHLKAQQAALLKEQRQVLLAAQHLDEKEEEHRDIVMRQLASMRHAIERHGAVGSPQTETKLSSPTAKLRPQDTLPYCELVFEKIIARGSFATVWRGRLYEETVAIKVVREELTPLITEHFIREVAVMSRLRNGYITRFYGACLEAHKACLVMEHMPQGSLYQVLRAGPLPPEQQQRIALAVARGLTYLHARGCIHGNLTSSHVVLDAQGQAKLADFSLARLATHSIRTAQLAMERHLPWCAPELLSHRAKPSPASDMYSYGTLLWEILTGNQPYARYQGKGSALQRTLLKGKREAIPDSIPRVYARLIQACWQASPYARPTLPMILKTLSTDPLYPVRPSSPTAEELYTQATSYHQQRDFRPAYTHYQQAAAKGHAESLAQVGLFGLQGRGGGSSTKPQVAAQLKEAAEQGSVTGMYHRAQMLEYGDAVPCDLDQALRWYQKAEQGGHPQAPAKVAKVRKKQQAVEAP